MEACWASCLGECSSELSREHLVSQSLFVGNEVTVQGFAWCKDEPKKIGLSNLTSKILCTRHNSQLSQVDDAGANAFRSIREMVRLSKIREKIKNKIWRVIKYEIDGRNLERWFLKTLINLSSNEEFPIGRDSRVFGRPSERLVRIAYGQEAFSGRSGLFSIVHQGMKLDSTDTIHFSPLIKANHHIEGGIFSFRGFIFLLFLEEDGPPPRLTGISVFDEDLGKSQLNFHNQQAIEKVGKYTSQILEFTW
jgi:hypothetical protein